MKLQIDLTDRDKVGSFTLGIRSTVKLSNARELAVMAASEADPMASYSETLTHAETASGWVYQFRFMLR